MPKKLKGGPLGFFNINSVAKHQKIEAGTLWGKFFSKKISQCRKKTETGDHLVSPGIACYAKNGKFFWFSSLGQMVQFDTIIFRRTFVELFCSVRVD